MSYMTYLKNDYVVCDIFPKAYYVVYGKTLDLDRKAGTNTIYTLNAYKKSRKMTQNGICDAATWKDLIAI